jgi:2-polyprenyl-3-methyl-5-hydroxy-6-metoxy-1,4-benzoquinol methylase
LSLDISGESLNKECPLEQNCSWAFLYHSSFNNYHLPIYRCNTCGLQTIHPKASPDYQLMYGESYYTGKSEYSYKDERKYEKYDSYVWDARLRNIKKFKKGGNFLDIGCSFGGFLERAKRAGFLPYGVEVSGYSAKFCESKGISVFNGNFLDSNFSENFFDVITMVEVIEHLEKPKEVFEKLYSILKPGGLLLLQTANFEGQQAKQEAEKYHYYLPGHLYYYSANNLQQILSSKGFTKHKVYYGVDFPLYAKLLKSRGYFTKLSDYRKWFRISAYHFKSKFFVGSTSSMVLYSFK